MAASGQYGIGAEMALRRQRAINTDSDSDEKEAVVGGSLRATLGVGHAEGAGGSNLTHNSDTEESMVTDGTTAESEGRKRRRVVTWEQCIISLRIWVLIVGTFTC